MADQNKRIIFQGEDGGVRVVVPPHDDHCDWSLEQIAASAVPPGEPYRIVDAADIPADRSMRAAWTVDPSDLTEGASG